MSFDVIDQLTGKEYKIPRTTLYQTMMLMFYRLACLVYKLDRW